MRESEQNFYNLKCQCFWNSNPRSKGWAMRDRKIRCWCNSSRTIESSWNLETISLKGHYRMTMNHGPETKGAILSMEKIADEQWLKKARSREEQCEGSSILSIRKLLFTQIRDAEWERSDLIYRKALIGCLATKSHVPAHSSHVSPRFLDMTRHAVRIQLCVWDFLPKLKEKGLDGVEATKQNAERGNSLNTLKTELQDCFAKWKQCWEKVAAFKEEGTLKRT